MYDSTSPHEVELPGSWNNIKGLDRCRIMQTHNDQI